MKHRQYLDDRLDREIEVEQIAMVKMDGISVWYPQKACRTIYGKSPAFSKHELTVTEFTPNVAVDENTFRFDFPKGTRINDRVRGIYGVDLPREPPSLVGKPLPPLENLNLSFDLDQVKDKMILVCFWDMNQRPSRNCIMQLAKQTEQLKQKGVAVITVQASKVDEKKLSEWVKKNRIPFPVGTIQGDEEKTRFAWGVRSLPWLILTDRNHVVTAEGFGLSELDGKIEQTEGD